MVDTYRAVLKGNHIEWLGQPPEYEAKREVHVEVTFLDKLTASSDASRGQEMGAALEQIAATGGVSGIQDPVSWQRRVRGLGGQE